MLRMKANLVFMWLLLMDFRSSMSLSAGTEMEKNSKENDTEVMLGITGNQKSHDVILGQDSMTIYVTAQRSIASMVSEEDTSISFTLGLERDYSEMLTPYLIDDYVTILTGQGSAATASSLSSFHSTEQRNIPYQETISDKPTLLPSSSSPYVNYPLTNTIFVTQVVDETLSRIVSGNYTVTSISHPEQTTISGNTLTTDAYHSASSTEDITTSTMYVPETTNPGDWSTSVRSNNLADRTTKTITASFSNVPEIHYSSTSTKFLEEKITSYSVLIPTSDSSVAIDGNHTPNVTGTESGYTPMRTTPLEILVTDISVVEPETTITLHNMSTIDHISGAIATNAWLYETISSTVYSARNTTSTLATRQAVPVLVNDKEWAVPVTVSLSLSLLASLIVLVLVCRRSRSQLANLRHRQNRHSVVEIGNQLRQTRQTAAPSSTASHTKRDLETVDKVTSSRLSNSTENFYQKDDNFNDKSYDNIHHTTGNVDKTIEMLELDSAVSVARDNQDWPKTYNSQFPNKKHPKNETVNYSNVSGVSSTLLVSNESENILQVPPRRKYRTKQAKDAPQPSKEYYGNMQMPSDTNNRMHKGRSTEETTAINDHYYKPPVTNASPDSQIGLKFNDRKRNKESRANYLGFEYSNDGYSQDDLGGWDTDGEYLSAGNEDMEKTAAKNCDDRSFHDVDVDIVDNSIHSAKSVTAGSDESKPGILKCVSFDESQLRAMQERTSAFDMNTSPNRKISTISESATAYLTVPGDFMNSSTAYKGVDNLAEIGNSPEGSMFFIGSYSEAMNPTPQNKNNIYSDSSTKSRVDNSNMFKEHKFPRNTATNAPPVREDSQTNQLQDTASKDRYIFPFMREAKAKIMADRDKRKHSGASNNDNPEEIYSLPNFNTPRIVTNEPQLERLVQQAELDSQTDTVSYSAFPKSSGNHTTSTIASNSSKIPKIVINKDDDNGNLPKCNQKEMQDSTTKSLRVRRIARANNPFLIEVDRPTPDSSEKIRRSSAPSMPRGADFVQSPPSRDRMIRSASGDHLSTNLHSEYFDLCDSNRHRPWSSEFLDLMHKSKSENPRDDERLKKMIDERYDALFSNKYPHLNTSMGSDTLSNRPQLPPRFIQLLADSNQKSLSQDTLGRLDDTSTKLPEEVAAPSRIRSLLQVPIARLSTSVYSHIPAITDKHLKTSLNQSQSQVTHVINPEPYTDMIGKANNSTDNVEFISEVQQSVPQPLERSSLRPNLRQGTDGIDNDDVIKTPGLPASGRKIHEPIKSRHLKTNVSSKSLHSVPISKLEWESFDDNPEVKLVNNPKLTSGTVETHPADTTSKRLTHDNTDDETALRLRDGLDNITDIPAVWRGAYCTDSVSNSSVVSNKDSVINANSKLLPTVVSDKDQLSAPTDRKPRLFDNNFDDYIDNETLKVFVNSNQESETRPCEEQDQQTVYKDEESNDQFATRNITTPPIKPRRKSRTSALKKETLQKLSKTPSVSQRADNQTDEKAGNETEEHSVTPKMFQMTAAASLLTPKQRLVKSRSHSLGESKEPTYRKVTRATSLETDKLSSYFLNQTLWSTDELQFVSSASNTPLQHTIQEESSNASSNADLESYFAVATTSQDSTGKVMEQKKHHRLALDRFAEGELQISYI